MQISTRRWQRLIGLIGLVGIFCSTRILAIEEDDSLPRELLKQVSVNQYRGHFHATLSVIDDNFSTMGDTLHGRVEFTDEIGERMIHLDGSRHAFEFHSFHFGREQWITDNRTHRIRRIANRQWKKGLFGNLLTYEDMLKLPSDFLNDYSSLRNLVTTDSTYQIGLVLKPQLQTFYSHLEVTLARNPVLVKSITFFSSQEVKLKTISIDGYSQVEDKWLFANLSVVDGDSLGGLTMNFRHFSFSPLPVAVRAAKGSSDIRISLNPLGAAAQGMETTGQGGSEEESADEVNN